MDVDSNAAARRRARLGTFLKRINVLHGSDPPSPRSAAPPEPSLAWPPPEETYGSRSPSFYNVPYAPPGTPTRSTPPPNSPQSPPDDLVPLTPNNSLHTYASMGTLTLGDAPPLPNAPNLSAVDTDPNDERQDVMVQDDRPERQAGGSFENQAPVGDTPFHTSPPETHPTTASGTLDPRPTSPISPARGHVRGLSEDERDDKLAPLPTPGPVTPMPVSSITSHPNPLRAHPITNDRPTTGEVGAGEAPAPSSKPGDYTPSDYTPLSSRPETPQTTASPPRAQRRQSFPPALREADEQDQGPAGSPPNRRGSSYITPTHSPHASISIASAVPLSFATSHYTGESLPPRTEIPNPVAPPTENPPPPMQPDWDTISPTTPTPGTAQTARFFDRPPTIRPSSPALALPAPAIIRRVRVFRLCHQCRTPFVFTSRHCAGCGHRLCGACPTSPLPQTTRYLGRRLSASSLDPAISHPAAITPEFSSSSAEASVRVQQRTYKSIRQRVRWTCGRCGGLFQETARTCHGCGHGRCGDCVRDPPKRVRTVGLSMRERDELWLAQEDIVKRVEERLRRYDAAGPGG